MLTASAYADSRPSAAFGVDHQMTHLKAWLNQAGVIAIDEARVQPTFPTPDPEGARRIARPTSWEGARR